MTTPYEISTSVLDAAGRGLIAPGFENVGSLLIDLRRTTPVAPGAAIQSSCVAAAARASRPSGISAGLGWLKVGTIALTLAGGVVAFVVFGGSGGGTAEIVDQAGLPRVVDPGGAGPDDLTPIGDFDDDSESSPDGDRTKSGALPGAASNGSPSPSSPSSPSPQARTPGEPSTTAAPTSSAPTTTAPATTTAPPEQPDPTTTPPPSTTTTGVPTTTTTEVPTTTTTYGNNGNGSGNGVGNGKGNNGNGGNNNGGNGGNGNGG